MATPPSSTVVTVSYQNWIGYNVLKYLAQYPLASAGIIAAISSAVTYSMTDPDPQNPNKAMQNAVISFVVLFALLYAVLWYYGSTLFSA